MVSSSGSLGHLCTLQTSSQPLTPSFRVFQFKLEAVLRDGGGVGVEGGLSCGDLDAQGVDLGLPGNVGS